LTPQELLLTPQELLLAPQELLMAPQYFYVFAVEIKLFVIF
jgi:hypothetical protein